VNLPNTDKKIGSAQKALESSFTTCLPAEAVKSAREKSGNKGKIIVSVIEKYLGDTVRLFENLRRNEFISNADNFKKMRMETRKKLHEGALGMVEMTKAWGERYASLAAELGKIE
jgi:hypothetical protein